MVKYKPARHEHECGAPLTSDCDGWCKCKYKGWKERAMSTEIILPEIGDWIDNDRAIELCLHFGLDEIAERISNSAFGEFNPWRFDGASMIPDAIVSEICNIPNLIRIALEHDLKYAYGIIGDDRAKLYTDFEFALDLLDDGASIEFTWTAFMAVAVFGKVRLGFEWGFARV